MKSNYDDEIANVESDFELESQFENARFGSIIASTENDFLHTFTIECSAVFGGAAAVVGYGGATVSGKTVF